MRGVASGDNGNHSGPQPSVGMYLDEQPITTIQGALDIHIYDIARVEVLAGPQGTLYGASSQAGTIRIITNKPDPDGSMPAMSSRATRSTTATSAIVARRLRQHAARRQAPRSASSAGSKHEPGYIDNVLSDAHVPDLRHRRSTTPTASRTTTTTGDKHGARAALGIDLNDNWTITPSVMGQKTRLATARSVTIRSVGDLEGQRTAYARERRTTTGCRPR